MEEVGHVGAAYGNSLVHRKSHSSEGVVWVLLSLAGLLLMSAIETAQATQSYRCQWGSHSNTEPSAVFGTDALTTCKDAVVKHAALLSAEHPGYSYEFSGNCSPTPNGNPYRCWIRRYQQGEPDDVFDAFYYFRDWHVCAASQLIHADDGVCVCPIGETYDDGSCVCPVGKVRKNGQCVLPPRHCVGNPCDPATGNKFQTEKDFAAAGGLDFVRTYNSADITDIGLGTGWVSSSHKRLVIEGGQLTAVREDGTGVPFDRSVGVWSADPDSPLELEQTVEGYVLNNAFGGTERYHPDGRIRQETTASGLGTSYVYDAEKRLRTVNGPFGHALNLDYGEDGRVSVVSAPGGRGYGYHYDANGNLVSVSYPDGARRTYHYEDPRFPANLTGITDANRERFSTFRYDAAGRVVSTEHAPTSNGVGQEYFSFEYEDQRTVVTDAVGERWTYSFDSPLGMPRLLSRKSQTDGSETNDTFDDQGNLLTEVDENGVLTVHAYDSNNRKVSTTLGYGTDSEQVTEFEYFSDEIDLPTRVVAPSVSAGKTRQALTSYDGGLNRSSSSVLGFDPSGASVSRNLSFEHNANGQVILIDGPRNDVEDTTRLTYFDCVGRGRCGQLASLTNALGHTITLDRYDANANLLQSTDFNGVMTLYEYDSRDRVTSIQRLSPGGDTRQVYMSYDPVGQLTSMTLANGNQLHFEYDNGHDLRGVTDGLGNRLEYSYDAKGNQAEVVLKNPGGDVIRVLQTDYDLRDRPHSRRDANLVSHFDHDPVGNLVSYLKPGSLLPTVYAYDALNRLVSAVDPLGQRVGYDYDKLGHLIRVEAPNLAATAFQYDDLGNKLSEQSIDRGTILYEHDQAGNVIAITDARGIRVNYSYDALNRIDFVDYPGVEEDLILEYDHFTEDGIDHCSYGVGRLCRIEDAAGLTLLSYDPWGNVIEEKRIESEYVYRTLYRYDTEDRVTSISYPSGRVVSYQRDLSGRISSIDSEFEGSVASIVTERSFRADGLLITQTFAGGLQETREYDRWGRLSAQAIGGRTVQNYEYDDRGNLTGRSSPVSSYVYDEADRLVAERLETGVVGDPPDQHITLWRYDENGNRVERIKGSGVPIDDCEPDLDISCDEVCVFEEWCAQPTGKVRAYSYLEGSNRLESNGNKPVITDPSGNILSDRNGKRTFEYNYAGSLSRFFKSGELRAEYLYNVRRQRIRKTVRRLDRDGNENRQAFTYFYDLEGNLISEYKNGRPWREYVWAGSMPVHQQRFKQRKDGSVSLKNSLNLVVDHLNAPRLAVDQRNIVVWRWDGRAFGRGGVHRDPDGDGVRRNVRLRFPGQFSDAESGLYYNWNRYYDPSTGRYISSDPIGLEGGINTYAYASSNPLRWFDPTGLAKMCCRLLDSIAGTLFRQRHCYLISDDHVVYGLYPEKVLGVPRTNDPRDLGGDCFDCPSLPCSDQDGCLSSTHDNYPIGTYRLLGPNSNTYAGTLARSCCKGGVPAGVKSAPGVNAPPPVVRN